MDSGNEKAGRSAVTPTWMCSYSNCSTRPLDISSDHAFPTREHEKCQQLSMQQSSPESNGKVPTSEDFSRCQSGVRFSSDSRNETQEFDEFDTPSNTSYHHPVMIGDSVGFKGGDTASTLGPLLEVYGEAYWLVAAHTFDGAFSGDRIPDNIKLVHPAEIDCPRGVVAREIGVLKYWSGPLYKTHRLSNYLPKFFPQLPRGSCQVITDWALCRACGDGLAGSNTIRYAPDDREFEPHSGIVSELFGDNPRLRLVRVAGRSSGLRYAVVSENPSQLSGDVLTKELYIENVPGFLSEEKWNTGGTGIPGDSGACVIDDETEGLLGMIWGRNVYGGDARLKRVAYFASIFDILDDINEKHPELGRPRIFSVRRATENQASIRRATENQASVRRATERQAWAEFDEADSVVDTVFSAEDSMSSQSSVQGVMMQAFRETLAALFIDRSGIVDIFKTGVQSSGIKGKRLADELRHALRDLGKALDQDAKTTEQKACSRRIRRDASYIADSIWRASDPDLASRRLGIDKTPLLGEDRRRNIMDLLQKGQPSNGQTKTPEIGPDFENPAENDGQSDTSIDLDEERETERRLSQRITELETFILRSDHLVALRATLQAIIEQDQIKRIASQNDRRNTQILGDQFKMIVAGRTLPEIVDRWLPQWLDFLWEPPVPHGMERIRWTCSCGQRLYDDYADPEAAVRKLKLPLERSRQPDHFQIPTVDRQATQRNLNPSGPMGTTKGPAGSALGRGGSSNVPLRSPIVARPPPIPSQPAPITERNRHFLLFSLQAGKEGYANVLRHAYVDQLQMRNDNYLFSFLRDKYIAERKLSSLLTLRTVSEIGNCRLRVDFSNFIQTLKKHSPNCPHDSVFCCGCWPDSSAISSYRYIPREPTEAFDVGKNYLIHHFRNPGCLDTGQTSVLCYIPLKKDTVLVAEASRAVTGWGIYFEEGWHWKTICVVFTGLMILVSIALGFAWWFVKSDFSGGWGVASFCVTSATLVVTVLGFMAHKSY